MQKIHYVFYFPTLRFFLQRQFKCTNDHWPFSLNLFKWNYNFSMVLGLKKMLLQAKPDRKIGCMSIMQYLWVTLVTKKGEHFPVHTHTHTQVRTRTRAHALPLLIPWHLHRPRCSDGLLDNRDNGAAVFHIGPGVYYSSGLALFPKRSCTKSPNLPFFQPVWPLHASRHTYKHACAISFDTIRLKTPRSLFSYA